MEYWINIILLFFIYGFAGWCMEVALKYRQFHRFINRGFLTGPLLPIYGSGTVLITLVVGNLSSVESGPVMTFSLSEAVSWSMPLLMSNTKSAKMGREFLLLMTLERAFSLLLSAVLDTVNLMSISVFSSFFSN